MPKVQHTGPDAKERTPSPGPGASLTPAGLASFPAGAGVGNCGRPAIVQATTTGLPGLRPRAREAGQVVATHSQTGHPSRYNTKSASLAGQGPSTYESRRRWRHARRHFLWLASSRPRVRKCGRVRLEGDTVIRVRDGVAHYAGLMSCGDVWVCPVCSAKIRNARAAEISDAAGRWERAGHGIYMVTLTVPHEAGAPLGDLWSRISAAMQGVRSGRAYQQVKASLGIVATVTAKEVTHGGNGWHPHLHILNFTTKPASGDGLYDLLVYMRHAWRREAAAAGLGLPDSLHGVKVDICYSGGEAGLYVAKVQDGRSVGNEVARGDLKSAGAGHRVPYEILADLERYGLVSDRDLWAEYEQVMRGKRALVWSRGYREILGMDPEQSDEEIAAAVVGGQAVAELSMETWKGILAAKRVQVPWSDVALPAYTGLLEAAERGGLDAVNVMLAALGIPAANAPPIRLGDGVVAEVAASEPDLEPLALFGAVS